MAKNSKRVPYWELEDAEIRDVKNYIIRIYNKHRVLQIGLKAPRLESGVKKLTAIHLSTMSDEELLDFKRVFDDVARRELETRRQSDE